MAQSSFELDETTVSELQRAMESGERTARSIAQLYLSRINELNLDGPELRAVIETNPDALQVADALDTERAAGLVRGPLHGIPIAIKDNINTHDSMTTTAGSLALEGSIPLKDAFIVDQLRAAGAVILAKLNMSEWAYFRGERASSGWSARGGQCRNPYVLDHNPCGSSSGSAVAASTNLAVLTIGTETSGSIMCPSSANGVVGIKPTVGIWSRSGIIPISHVQDTAGPICRTVSDAAALLGPLTGVDADDSATAASRGKAHRDYVQFLDPEGLRGARIGVARHISDFDPRVMALFDRAVETMTEAGAVMVDPVDVADGAWNSDDRLAVMEYEFKAALNAYLDSLGPDAPVRSLADIIDFNERHAELELAHFGQERFTSSQERGPLSNAAYLEGRAAMMRSSREDGIDALITKHRLDAIVAPTAGIPWPTDHVNGDPSTGSTSSGLAAVAGYPAISVPMGFVGPLPLGISFFGSAWSEPTLLAVAYAYEQATNHRRPPTFAATLDSYEFCL
jgi:amidase